MSSSSASEKILREGLAALGFEPTPDAVTRLLHYVELLRRWGKVYNLTAIDRPEEVIRLHLLDSLSIWTHLRGERILDVGTGAGLPGIPLAILLPVRRFELLDRSAKKIRFVLQTAIELGLENVRGLHCRVEDFDPDERFDSIVVRAFGSLADIWSQTGRLLNETGVILAMKGRSPELNAESVPGARIRVIPLRVPGLEAERHLVELTVSHQ